MQHLYKMIDCKMLATVQQHFNLRVLLIWLYALTMIAYCELSSPTTAKETKQTPFNIN